MREQGTSDNDLFERLAGDARLGLTADDLAALVAEPLEFTGAAVSQVNRVVARIGVIAAKNPEAANYSPGDIL